METAMEWEAAKKERRVASKAMLAAAVRESKAKERCIQALGAFLAPVPNGHKEDA